jgi:pimeloyl-ACP methyl ester carboxylesterase
MAHADVDGRKLFYSRRGSGEPLLLIQGMTGNHLHWGEPFVSLLDDHFETVAYDHRGAGNSDPPDGSFSMADLASDAAAVLDAVGWETAHVFGVSMGGMLAQRLALDHPDRLRTLALGCTTAGGATATPTDREVVDTMRRLVMAGQADEAARQSLIFNVSPAFAADRANIEPFREIARQIPPMGLAMMGLQLQAIGTHDVADKLGAITAPTLVLHGELDRILPVANGRLVAERIPGARLEIFGGVGHVFWWERPRETAQLLREHAGVAVTQ